MTDTISSRSSIAIKIIGDSTQLDAVDKKRAIDVAAKIEDDDDELDLIIDSS